MKSKTIILLALTICSYLPANAYTPPLEPKTEFEQLTVIMVKYGNNPDGLQALDHAVLKEDEYAVDLLLKYGATPGWKGLELAEKTGNYKIFLKLVNNGARLYWFKAYTILVDAIRNHRNDFAIYLIHHGPEMGHDFVSRDHGYLNIAEDAKNTEIADLLKSLGCVRIDMSCD